MRVDQLISGVWASRPRATTTIVPDARIDLLWAPGRDPWVAGADTGPVAAGIQLDPGQVLVGVQLRIGAAAPALRVDAAELTDRRVPLSDLYPAAEVRRLRERLEEITDTRARAHALAIGFGRLAARAGDPDPLVAERIAGVLGARRPGRAPVPVPVPVSDRQMRRRFTRAVGYGPKLFDRVIRFQRFLARVSVDPDTPLAWIASDLGYADEAHLARDCRALAGRTPASMRRGGTHVVAPVPAAGPVETVT